MSSLRKTAIDCIIIMRSYSGDLKAADKLIDIVIKQDSHLRDDIIGEMNQILQEIEND